MGGEAALLRYLGNPPSRAGLHMANRTQRLSRTSSKQWLHDGSKNEGNISGTNGLHTVPPEVRIVVEYVRNL